MTAVSKSEHEIAYLLTVLIIQQSHNNYGKEGVLSIYTESLETIRGVRSAPISLGSV
jgi:hypothetical protein